MIGSGVDDPDVGRMVADSLADRLVWRAIGIFLRIASWGLRTRRRGEIEVL